MIGEPHRQPTKHLRRRAIKFPGLKLAPLLLNEIGLLTNPLLDNPSLVKEVEAEPGDRLRDQLVVGISVREFDILFASRIDLAHLLVDQRLLELRFRSILAVGIAADHVGETRGRLPIELIAFLG